MTASTGSPTQPIEVLHLITGLGLGGAETMLYKLLAAMDTRAYPSTVVSLRGTDVLTPRIQALGIEVTSLGMRGRVGDLAAVVQLASLLRRRRPTIVQTWMYHANVLGLAAARTQRGCKVAWNIRCSDLNFSQASFGLRSIFRAHAALSGFADAVVVNSASGMSFHRHAGHQSKRWELIQNGFDLDKFRPDAEVRREVRRELSISDDELVIGMLARYDVFKDHRTFIDAAALLGASHPHVRFVLAGRGVSQDNPEIQGQVERLGLRKRLLLLGEYAQPARLLAALDIGTLSSLTEGFPNALGEAMSAGLPCVATDVGDCAMLLAETGFTVPLRDPEALARRWRALIDAGPTERERLGMAARERIGTHFSMSRIARAYESLYSSIAARD